MLLQGKPWKSCLGVCLHESRACILQSPPLLSVDRKLKFMPLADLAVMLGAPWFLEAGALRPLIPGSLWVSQDGPPNRGLWKHWVIWKPLDAVLSQQGQASCSPFPSSHLFSWLILKLPFTRGFASCILRAGFSAGGCCSWMLSRCQVCEAFPFAWPGSR